MAETVYKLGDLVEHRWTKQLFVIISITKISSDYYVQSADIVQFNPIKRGFKCPRWRLDKFAKRFKPALAAQILYKDNSNKAVT